MNRTASGRWTTAQLVEPVPSGYVLIAARSGRWSLPIPPPRAARRRMLQQAHAAARQLADDATVRDVVVLRGIARPPGRRDAPSDPYPLPASYDVALLAETVDPAAAGTLADSGPLDDLRAQLGDPLVIVGRNVRRIGPVDHARQGVFLLNYFSAETTADTLDAWQYTAGWFQAETGLDNSCVIEPLHGAQGPFTIVNHCRWDRLRDVVPQLVFRRSFRTFVLREFAKRGVAPHPVLYALDR